MRVKNDSGSNQVWCGQTINDQATYDIQANEIHIWRSNDKVIQDITSMDLLIGDSISYKSTSAEAIGFLMGTLSSEVRVLENPPFANKKIGTKKLFTRAYGKTFSLSVGVNTLDFTIPFNEVKFNGIEIDNAKYGEKVSLKVLDTTSGTLSGVPNYMLNQFGYDVNLPNGFYRRMSDYDADLIIGLQIRIEYTATEARTIGINYMIHELKV